MEEVDMEFVDGMEEWFPDFEIDPDYEFSAPHRFDFIEGETQEEAEEAERWFETAGSYEASPFVAKIKQKELLFDEITCSFQESQHAERDCPSTSLDVSALHCDNPIPDHREDMSEDMELSTPRSQVIPNASRENKGPSFRSKTTLTKPTASYLAKQRHSGTRGTREFNTTKQMKPRCTRDIQMSRAKSSEKGATQENQAVKRQKLEGGRLRQIVNAKEQLLPHKVPSKLVVSKDLTAGVAKDVAGPKERQKISSSKVRRFQSKALEFHNSSVSHAIPQQSKLKLTIPKEPELGTAQRARPVRVKSTAELEEEMLAKIPKFKARPLNKRILEAPSLPLLQKSAPKLPEFKEFNLKTLERALQQSGTASSMSSSTDSALIAENFQHKPASGGGLTEPRMPHLETSLRARPAKVKSSEETEQKELERIDKFKARPLNKKIFSSKGDLGIFCNFKREVTTPVEFHFSTNERFHSPPPPTELFTKLSLNSEPHQHPVPQPTVPQPFHLLTEERGAEKERKFMLEMLHHEHKEQEIRIPKANPLPYTIDTAIIPTKPKPKECTKVEPFQLESLIRHEKELQRKMEEQARSGKEESEMRNFRAQPNMCNMPVNVPEVPRMPLTEVQEFTFRVDKRAVEREEFEKKVAEKQDMYKRFREEYEAAKMMEDERAVKIMRKTMVPHARPMLHFNKPCVPQRSGKDLKGPVSSRLKALQCRDQRTNWSKDVKAGECVTIKGQDMVD